MPIQVYQKKNTLLPALEMFAKYLAPIAEQKQLATLSQGQSDIYKNVKDPIELAQVHSQYIEQLNSNSDISAQNKQQLLQNANMYVGLKEGQLKEFKRVQTANTIADFMTGEVSKKKLVWKGQLVQGDIVAKELQQLSNGDPEVYAKMVEQAATSGAVKYDTGIGYNDKGNIVGTSGYTDAQGNPFETQSGIIKEYQTKNGKVLYTDKNADNTFNKGEGLNSRDAAEYGKMMKYELNRQQDIKDTNRRFNISESNANRRMVAANTKQGNFTVDGKSMFLQAEIDPISRTAKYYDLTTGKEVTGAKVIKGVDDPGNVAFANEKEVTSRDKGIRQSEYQLLQLVQPFIKKDIPTEDEWAYSDFNSVSQTYFNYKSKIYDNVIKDIETKVKNEKKLNDTEDQIYNRWIDLNRQRKEYNAVQSGAKKKAF